jgi:hypothetical protein
MSRHHFGWANGELSTAQRDANDKFSRARYEHRLERLVGLHMQPKV